MKIVATKEAIGLTLCQDMTQIIAGVKKGARFKRGHVVKKEDIPVLLSMGKEHLYVWEENDTLMHEEDAASVLFKLCQNKYIEPTDVKEGKIEALATTSGILTIDQKRLYDVNATGQTMIATRPPYFVAQKGDKLAGMRIIPLMIEKETMDHVQKKVGQTPLLTLHPFQHKKIGVINTGSEIYKGLIQDGFGPVIKEKVAAFGGEIVATTVVDDSLEMIKQAIEKMKKQKVDLIFCTSGMSVDPDDMTAKAIKETADTFICHGTPVLPGSMFALAYTKENQCIMGLPGAVIFSKQTVFDLILPRVMADIPVSFEDIASLGLGGLL